MSAKILPFPRAWSPSDLLDIPDEHLGNPKFTSFCTQVDDVFAKAWREQYDKIRPLWADDE